MLLISKDPVSQPGDVSRDDAELLFKEARRRERRRRRMAWALAFLASALVAAGLVADGWAVFGTGSNNGRAPANPPKSATVSSTTMPSELVAIGANSTVEVLSSRSGHVIRTLATDSGSFLGGGNPSVSRTGLVYFDEGIPNHGNPMAVINRVPLRGGPVVRVANHACEPSVSADGRYLAFLSGLGACNPGIHPANAVTVLDLVSGQRHSWYATSSQGYVNSSFIYNLSWSPDNRNLSFTSSTGIGPDNVVSYELLDRTNHADSLQAARRIPVPAAVEWIGFSGIGSRPLQGVGVLHGSQSFFVALDGSSGRIITTIRAVPANPDPKYWQITSVSGGRFFILQTSLGYPALLRWSLGAPEPTRLATASGGTWVPRGT